jgi:FkbM family methyltransferase
MNKARITNFFQRYFSKSPAMVSFWIRIRNQANKIIGYSLAQSSDSYTNGELRLLEKLSGRLAVVFDVGANAGEWTEMVLNCHQQGVIPEIHLFEPGPGVFKMLSENFKDRQHLILNQCGLSDKEGSLQFFENITFNQSSSFIDFENGGTRKVHEVPVTTVAAYCELKNIFHIDFLKIDCEGFDFKVLQGCGEMLEKGQIEVIQFEYGSTWALSGATLLAACRLLSRHHYRVYYLLPMGLQVFNPEIIGDFFQYANFIALHKDSDTFINEIIQQA